MKNETPYKIHPDYVDDYQFGPCILVRVDSRIGANGYVYAYAPLSLIDGLVKADPNMVFWDLWGEVIEID